MFKSTLYPEIRSMRKQRLHDKMTQIFIATAVGFIVGVLAAATLIINAVH